MRRVTRQRKTPRPFVQHQGMLRKEGLRLGEQAPGLGIAPLRQKPLDVCHERSDALFIV
jgi:hypothetical protein